MAKGKVRMIPSAVEEQQALPTRARRAVRRALKQLAKTPHQGTYDEATNSWTIVFHHGQGILVYVATTTPPGLTILRIIHL